MIAPRIVSLTTLMIVLGYALGHVPIVSESLYISSFTPLSKIIAVKISSASAAGLNISILLSAISAIVYSARSKDRVVEIFEWYGCLIFGVALSVFCYWVMMSGYLFVSSVGGSGRSMRLLYLVLEVPIALYVVSVLFFVVGNFGLYLLVKAPKLLMK